MAAKQKTPAMHRKKVAASFKGITHSCHFAQRIRQLIPKAPMLYIKKIILSLILVKVLMPQNYCLKLQILFFRKLFLPQWITLRTCFETFYFPKFTLGNIRFLRCHLLFFNCFEHYVRNIFSRKFRVRVKHLELFS